MRQLILAATALALMAGAAAHAQEQKGPKTPLDLMYEEQEQEQKRAEKAYNETMKRLKSQNPTQVTNDPWRTIRPAEPPKSKR